MHIKLKNIVLLSACLTFAVIVLGAYTRLKDAGLGCPDWPGCYGKLIAPKTDTKAWTEMVHRYVAGALSVLILYITVQAVRSRHILPKLSILSTTLLCIVILQGLLGMWTVTMRLHPVVVMAHLLGGFTILGLLCWMYLKLIDKKIGNYRSLKIFTFFCLIILSCQIALGGWTSANYAGLICTDFPTCQGQIWPTVDWHNVFNHLTIQMAHRVGALLTAGLLCILSFNLLRIHTSNIIFKFFGYVILVALGLQIILGVTNVVAGLPLLISLAHSAIAALLLVCLISVQYFLSTDNNGKTSTSL